jgi:hypothetical protein
LAGLASNDCLGDKNLLKVLVCNKMDLLRGETGPQEEEEEEEQGRRWATENGMLFASLSASSNAQVSAMVHKVVRALQNGESSVIV